MNTDYYYHPIILVEDNPVDLDLILRALKKHNLGNTVEVARDGQEILDWIPRWEKGEALPCVILLDLKLPKISGLEVLRQLRAHPISKSIPIVVLTSSSEDKDIETAYSLHVNSYIVKPVNFEKFIEVTRHIERAKCAFST